MIAYTVVYPWIAGMILAVFVTAELAMRWSSR